MIRKAAVNIPLLLDNKTSMVDISTDDGKRHISWELDKGRILVFEENPMGIPKTTLTILNGMNNYLGFLLNTNWTLEKLNQDFKDKVFAFSMMKNAVDAFEVNTLDATELGYEKLCS